MLVRFKKLHIDAVAPQQATAGAGGFDLTAASVSWDEDTQTWMYGTKLAVQIPVGHVGLLFPRSSIYKTTLSLTNCVGVIDSDYRGEISFRFHFERHAALRRHIYDVGDRIGQLIILPYPAVEFVEADELNDTARGTGGFGSSGR